MGAILVPYREMGVLGGLCQLIKEGSGLEGREKTLTSFVRVRVRTTSNKREKVEREAGQALCCSPKERRA